MLVGDNTKDSTRRTVGCGIMVKADSTLRSSRAVPHPSTDRALCRLTSEVGRDPVHSTRYGRQREWMFTKCVSLVWSGALDSLIGDRGYLCKMLMLFRLKRVVLSGGPLVRNRCFSCDVVGFREGVLLQSRTSSHMGGLYDRGKPLQQDLVLSLHRAWHEQDVLTRSRTWVVAATTRRPNH